MSSELQELRGELRALRLVVEGALSRCSVLEERINSLEEGEAWVAVDSGPAGSTSGGEVDKNDTEGRRRLAQELGRFLRRAVSGGFRGDSGRQRLGLANRGYLIIADFQGKVLPAPIYTDSFQEVRNICKEGANLGDSIFLGFATKWEAKVACVEGGFAVPSILRNV